MDAPDLKSAAYIMPDGRLRGKRRGGSLYVGAVLVLDGLLWVVYAQVMVAGTWTGPFPILGAGIALACLVLALRTSAPITMHNRLVIWSDGLVPLERPFGSRRDAYISADDATISAPPDANNSEAAFLFVIRARAGRTYRVSSYVLERYDGSQPSRAEAYRAMQRLADRTAAAPAGRPSPAGGR